MYNINGQNFDLGGEVRTEDILKDIIEADQQSQAKAEMVQGVNYYNTDNDILKRDFRTYYVDSVKYTDHNKSNDAIVNNLHKKLVDQKNGYISSKKVVIESDVDKLAELVIELLGEEFQDTLQDWIKGACNKGIENIQPFVTDDGEFDYTVIPAEQTIFITDTTFQKNVEQAIRYYVMEWVKGDKIEKSLRVEVWDDEKVTRYQEIQDAITGQKTYTFIQPNTMGITLNPEYHWYTYNTNFTDKSQINTFNDVDLKGVEANGWGRVPIVSLLNNSEKRTDLVPIKRYIDALDIVSSGFLNDLKDVQLAIWVLRGYGGDSLADFMLNLQKFKAISLDNEDSSSAEPKTMEIPKEARIALMEWLEKKIYEVGQGVNEADISGGSITNVVIKAMYAGLDLKADQLITKLRVSLSEFMFFVVEFINDRDNTTYNYKDLKFTFNKSMIFNTKEIIETLVMLINTPVVSNKTIMTNIPFVDDIEKELKQIKIEEQERLNGLGGGMGFGTE